MRNPLTPIRLAVAQLTRNAAAQQQEVIEVLVTETGRLEQLAREFTEFGRLPEGPAAPVDLAELLAGLARTAVPPTMQVRLDLDPTLPTLLGHYDPLHRAFSNIVRNAVEACGGEGIIELAARSENGGVRIEFRDHGPGVPAELTERLFDPYVTGKSGGTGLGLALARQTVEMHQGAIAVEPTPGGGATFVVRIRGR
jgi:signal transduction histidine kinase